MPESPLTRPGLPPMAFRRGLVRSNASAFSRKGSSVCLNSWRCSGFFVSESSMQRPAMATANLMHHETSHLDLNTSMLGAGYYVTGWRWPWVDLLKLVGRRRAIRAPPPRRSDGTLRIAATVQTSCEGRTATPDNHNAPAMDPTRDPSARRKKGMHQCP